MQFHLKDSAEKCRITFIEGPNDHERLPTGSTCALELQLASYEDYGTFREWMVVPSEAVAVRLIISCFQHLILIFQLPFLFCVCDVSFQ